ncbi:hypothetical protein Aazo_3803 ['Nostoc azollae' 0708]|uniref:Uncharacterized protein n=1 Tax=Nostoc azollae (strain 0708) TaxID=551115 RepID=D7E4B3_NOSA0|nr:hypothetical protein Aazo_3803 ['Nostoc azollae' 0708]
MTPILADGLYLITYSILQVNEVQIYIPLEFPPFYLIIFVYDLKIVNISFRF